MKIKIKKLSIQRAKKPLVYPISLYPSLIDNVTDLYFNICPNNINNIILYVVHWQLCIFYHECLLVCSEIVEMPSAVVNAVGHLNVARVTEELKFQFI